MEGERAICSCKAGYFGDPLSGCRHECESDYDCSGNLACIDFKCKNPCAGACGTLANCEVRAASPNSGDEEAFLIYNCVGCNVNNKICGSINNKIIIFNCRLGVIALCARVPKTIWEILTPDATQNVPLILNALLICKSIFLLLILPLEILN